MEKSKPHKISKKNRKFEGLYRLANGEVCFLNSAICEIAELMMKLGFKVRPASELTDANVLWEKLYSSYGKCNYAKKVITLHKDSVFSADASTVAHELCHLLDTENFLWGTEYSPVPAGKDEYEDSPREIRARIVSKKIGLK